LILSKHLLKVNAMSISPRFAYVLTLLVAAVLCRWLPHPPNFAPVLAIALFGGAAFKNGWEAYLLPLGIMFLSDLIIGLHGMMPLIYALMVGFVLVGRWIGQKRSLGRIAGGAIGSSVVFFMVTNFAVWIASPLYPLNGAGLAACYAAAIPFFQNTLVSTVLFSAVLFGSLELGERKLPLLRPATA